MNTVQPKRCLQQKFRSKLGTILAIRSTNLVLVSLFGSLSPLGLIQFSFASFAFCDAISFFLFSRSFISFFLFVIIMTWRIWLDFKISIQVRCFNLLLQLRTLGGMDWERQEEKLIILRKRRIGWVVDLCKPGSAALLTVSYYTSAVKLRNGATQSQQSNRLIRP